MSRDGYLPDGVEYADLPGYYDEEHVKYCPLSEDYGPVFSECGGMFDCECYPETLIGLIRAWWNGPCAIDDDPECCCPTYEDVKNENAQARMDAKREDW